MRNNGLIDPKPCFSPACCFSRPVYKFSIIVAQVVVNIPRYFRIHWKQSGQGKEAAGGCLSTPCSLPAPARCACTAPTSQCWWYLPQRAGKPKALIKARRQSKTLKLQVWNSHRTWIEAQSACGGPKQVWKPEARRRIEAQGALLSQKHLST